MKHNQLVIIPITKIQELCNKTEGLDNFFNKVPLTSIIDIIVDSENPTDLSTALWEEIEYKLTDYELEKIDLCIMDFFFSMIIELFYEELYSVINQKDINFHIFHWLPDSVCLIPNKRNVSNPNNYPPSDF